MAGKTVSYILSADIGQFQARMAQASASVRKFASDATAISREGAKTRASLDTIGNAAGKVGLVAAAGLTAAVVVAADFEQAMSGVKAATNESAANMDLLRAAAIRAGAETAFSAREAAAGIEQLAKAGVSTSDILSGGLDGALALAAAGGIEVAEAAETAAKAMTQFGLSGEQVPHIADLLAAAAGKASGEVTDFAAALNQSGLVANQMGLSIEETTGGLAAFAEAGLLGSDAGTSFKATLQALTPNSEKAAAEMERLGISAFDAQGNFVGLAEFSGNLRDALGGLTDEQRASTLETIFGSDAVRAASVLYEQGESGIRQWTAAVDDQGFAAETAATKMNNLKGDLEEFKGSLETALIGLGEGGQGPLRALVQGATDVVNAFGKLPPVAQNAAAGLLAITAVVGGTAFLGAKVIGGIASTKEALETLGISAGKTGTALGKMGRAATIAGGLLAGLAVVDALQGGLTDYTIGVEEMTAALLDLNKVGPGNLPTNLDGISESIDRLADPNKAQSAQDNIAGVLGFGGGSELGQAQGQIEGLDAALTQMVSSGNAEAAAQSLENLGLSGGEMQDLLSLMPRYAEALTGVANEAEIAESANRALAWEARNVATAAQIAGEGARDGAGGVNEMAGALENAGNQGQTFKGVLEQLSGFLDQRAALRNYEAALDDLTQSVKENGKTFDIATPKGRANQTALDGIASSALIVAQNMKGANKVEFLRGTIGDIRAAAQAMGLPQREIQGIISKLREANATKSEPKVDAQTEQADRDLDKTKGKVGEVDKARANPKVTANVAAAFAALTSLRSYLSGIPDETVNVTIRRNTIGGVTSSAGGRTAPGIPSADGNLFEFASGGYLPSIGAQSPQIRPYTGPAGLTWSEEGSGPWEAFISGHPGKAARSRSIADDVVARLGGQTQWFANGGMTASSAPSVNANVSAAVSLTDAQFRRLESATERGAAVGVFKGMKAKSINDFVTGAT